MTATTPQGVVRTLRRTARAAPAFTEGIATTVLLALVGSGALLAGPLLLQQLLDTELLVPGQVDAGRTLTLGAVALVVAVVGMFANQRATRRMLIQTSQGTATLRLRTLDRLHAVPLQDVTGEQRGSLLARVTSDVEVVTDFMGWGGIGFAVGAIRVVAALVAVAVVEPMLLAVLVLPLAVYAGVLLASQRTLLRAHDRVRGDVAASTSVVGEAVAGLATIRGTGSEAHTIQRAEAAIERQRGAEVRAAVLGAVLFSSAELFATLLTGVTVAAGVLLVGVVELGVGDVVAVLFLVTLLLDPVQTMVETVHEAQAAAAGLRRVLEVLDASPEHAGDPGVRLPAGPLGLEVASLRFAYEHDRPVLADVSLEIAPGRHVALVGTTGSGKTTLAKQLVRLLPVQEGEVRLGGVPLACVPEPALRRRVAFVPQEVFLFDDTVGENLRHADADATDEQLHAVLDQLDLDGWVAGLPDGLATQVGERGSRLSAGERQLVALARAALVDPDLLVLDEATSSVDPDLEVRLRRAVEVLGSDRTVVTVAHRLSTAEAADEVFVFSGGHLVQRGAHTELLATDGAYAQLHADWTRGTALG